MTKELRVRTINGQCSDPPFFVVSTNGDMYVPAASAPLALPFEDVLCNCKLSMVFGKRFLKSRQQKPKSIPDHLVPGSNPSAGCPNPQISPISLNGYLGISWNKIMHSSPHLPDPVAGRIALTRTEQHCSSKSYRIPKQPQPNVKVSPLQLFPALFTFYSHQVHPSSQPQAS